MDISGSWPYIESVAKSRLAHNKTKRHVDEYGDYIERIGAAGEIVARRYLGLGEELHEQFDHGIDFRYLDKTFDVKATKLTSKVMHRHLQWPLWKEIKADIIILTAINEELKIGTVIGYALKNEIKEANKNPNRNFPCYEIPISELHPGWLLLAKRLEGKFSL